MARKKRRSPKKVRSLASDNSRRTADLAAVKRTNPTRIGSIRHEVSRFSDYDIHLFKEGCHTCLYEKLGAHRMSVSGQKGIYFALWAPNAKSVSVIGDFNQWQKTAHPLAVRWDSSGIWEGFVPGLRDGALYKYHIQSYHNNYTVDKSDPFGFVWENPPRSATKTASLEFTWQDEAWMSRRGKKNSLSSPISIYEVHIGSWRRVPDGQNRLLTYREIAPYLAEYVKEVGFSHVEFLPVMEHPFYGSWGYQTLGYFAPSSRYGTPQDFMYLVEYLHAHDIGVILDWVPSHFPADEHGLVYFDGTHLYEHADERKGFHPDWKSYIFNYGRPEVKNFLISSALFWLDKYHVDGLRVDAVASMLYLDYSRSQGQWVANEYGGRENLEAIYFLRQLNEIVYKDFPDVQMIAEESTSWPMVSRPLYVGGLGFGLKWNMGWMHDTLEYYSKDPIYRKYHHNQLTFSIWYAFSENFVLALSHDEVVYGKGSLLAKMPGDDWQKRANLRLLLGYMYLHPGKKLLFMGGEFGQWNEWYHESSLDWHLVHDPRHGGIKQWVSDLNSAYKNQPSLHQLDCFSEGFQWVDCNNTEESIISFLRKGYLKEADILVVCNLTPVGRRNYRVGVPLKGEWTEILNSDATCYGGSGQGNAGSVKTTPVSSHGRYQSLSLTLPPLSILVLRHTG